LLNLMSSSISSQAGTPTSSPPTVRFSPPAPPSDIPSSITEPLHFAAMNNHIDCVEVVLDNISKLEKETGKDASHQHMGMNAKDRQGLTAAHHSSLNGHLDVLSLLLKRGADILS
jgi:ankyrin repeat protein